MIIAWGDDLLDTTQGLDILGVRGVDQAVELALVNGITTISQRARYFGGITVVFGFRAGQAYHPSLGLLGDDGFFRFYLGHLASS